MISQEIRNSFLKFFNKQSHPIIQSSPLIPQGDPSLLFTSAGMVQFKPYYLGLKTDLKRATSCQKCFRTTDIDNVGKTIRHLTFFEMLGNFSFGDYFKEESLKLGYDFLTKEMNINPERLYFSIYKGGVAPKDEETYLIWKKILPSNLHSHIFEMGEDNFWSMGETGPSGPCSEIYYDRGEEFSHKGCLGPGCSCDRYIEIWNHVFTQFDRQSDGSFKLLPKKNIDTGMGLERLTFIVENKYSPFETTLFYPIIEEVLKLNPSLFYDHKQENVSSFRIIADHLRGASFLLSEGILPSNEGRGYVLRRLIRRAERFAMLLGFNDAFLYKLVPSLISIFKEQYPQLVKNQKEIELGIKYEEEGFLKTLKTGEKYLEEIIKKSSKTIRGEDVFNLYETYGFPLELTKEIALKNKLEVDELGFNKAKESASELSKLAWKSSGESDSFVFQKAQEKFKDTIFTGYESLEENSKIMGILNLKGDILKKTDKGLYYIIFDKTPFYAESGGQIADTGEIFKNEKIIGKILDVQKPFENIFYHKVELEGEVKPEEEVFLKVNKIKRKNIEANHTSVHLINEALKRVFGNSIRQAGSFVNEEKFRFDYTINQTPTKEEIKKVEDIANEAIIEGYKVFKEIRPLKDAQDLGAVSLLGEKYKDPARFVLINKKGFKDVKDRFSLELCGGTHVDDLKDIFFIKILKDSSLSRGIRRIEGLSSYSALSYLNKDEEIIKDILNEFSFSKAENIKESILKFKNEIKKLKDELNNIKLNGVKNSNQRENFKLKNNINLLIEEISGSDIKMLRNISDKLKNENKNSFIFLYIINDNKINFTFAISNDLNNSDFNANIEANKIANIFEGKAGGRKDFAQGGGILKEDFKNIKDKIIALF